MQRQSFENICENSSASLWQAPVDDNGLPPPEIMSDEAMNAQAGPHPYWAHRKIVHVDAFLAQHAGFFGNRKHIRLQTQYIPRMTANDRFIRGYSTAPGHWLMRDFDQNVWRPTVNTQHSAIVRIQNGGNHNDLFYGMYFCPDAGLEAFSASNPLVLWVQNYHLEGNTQISEGNTHPNDGNHMQIDRGVGYPFPNGGDYFRF